MCHKNKTALEYSLSCIPLMKKFAEPLQRYLGIHGFGYLRTYTNCEYIKLFSGYEDYNKVFFDKIRKPDLNFLNAWQNSTLDQPSFYLWPVQYKNTPILELHDHYDIWHGFQITFRRKDYCEKVHFNFNKQSGDKSSFYMENIPYLLEFTKHFIQNAADLFDDNDKAKIAVYDEKFDISNTKNANIEMPLDHISKNQIFKDKCGNLVRVTKKEIECIECYFKYGTAKAAAEKLNISPRTVELHLQNIKKKLSISYKSELIDIFFKQKNNLLII